MTKTYTLPLLYKAHLIEIGKTTYDCFHLNDEDKTKEYTPEQTVEILKTIAWGLTLEPNEVLALKLDKTSRDNLREMFTQEHERLLKEDDYKQWLEQQSEPAI